MTVYVDDMYKSPMGQFGCMKMSHMVASDGEPELLEFAGRIGLARRWLQAPGQGRSRVHFDVAISIRNKAVAAGAVEVSMLELGRMTRAWVREDRA